MAISKPPLLQKELVQFQCGMKTVLLLLLFVVFHEFVTCILIHPEI